jgi:hypothetical protein
MHNYGFDLDASYRDALRINLIVTIKVSLPLQLVRKLFQNENILCLTDLPIPIADNETHIWSATDFHKSNYRNEFR